MSTAEPIRRPGSPWRLLVHEYVGEQPDGTCYGRSHDVSNYPAGTAALADAAASWPDLAAVHSLPLNTEFDELVTPFLHIEAMDHNVWWMDLGGLTVHVTTDEHGSPTRVSWDLDDKRDDVTYEDRT